MNPHKTKAWEEVRTTFKEIWGYEDFRPPQGEIVSSLLAQKDAIIKIGRAHV